MTSLTKPFPIPNACIQPFQTHTAPYTMLVIPKLKKALTGISVSAGGRAGLSGYHKVAGSIPRLLLTKHRGVPERDTLLLTSLRTLCMVDTAVGVCMNV